MKYARLFYGLLALGLLVACESTTTIATGDGAALPESGGNVDVARDSAPPTDTKAMDAPAGDASSLDVPGMDAPGMDVPGMDAPGMDVPRRCTDNASCAGSPAGAVCDTTSGMCVQCVPTADTCPANLHCSGTTCVAGCRSDEGCGRAPGPGDSGPGAMLRCETMAHACVECVLDAHCRDGSLCVGNVCVAGCTAARPCPTGQTCCSGACIDPQTNLAHCGMCDTRCAVPNAMPACMNGRCSVGVCTAPFGDCNSMSADGCETNTQSDLRHCGMCGAPCAARAHATATCASARCEFVCDSGFADCNAEPADGCETNLNESPARCGSCATRCDPPNASAACRMGRCEVGACSMGFGDCDMNATNGCETNTRTTVNHCGGCGTVCPERPNSFPGCVAGACVISCVAGFADCNGDALDGCETDTRTSAGNCGSCARVCTAPSGTAACAMSVCRVAGCDDGRGNCDGEAANGCETDLRGALTHCGTCGTTCPERLNSSPVCAMAVCGITCSMGFGNCDGMDANGCEVDTTSAVSHCGACSRECALANATSRCEASTCRVSMCSGSFANCDGMDANGCEVDTATSVGHCGGCNRGCSFPHAAASCAAGVCSMGLCDAGFSDCDLNPLNGCETAGTCRYASCNAVPRGRPDGAYTLTAGGTDWTAYCDMTSAGGGWTLILKADGRQRTFLYSSALWTNTVTLNPGSTNMSETEAKFTGFSTLGFTNIRAGMRDGGTLRFITVPVTSGSFRALFTGGYRATTVGRTGWLSLLASPSLQANCNMEGFNVPGDPGVEAYQRVRFGILGNQEDNCGSPDSHIGFGGENNLCACRTPSTCDSPNNSIGNVASCEPGGTDPVTFARDTRTFGYIFVR